MRSVGRGEMIEVATIGIGGTGRTVEIFWIGGDVIRASEMRFRVRACTDETC